ncbi:hypothetical protein HMPREF1624_04712 [Sporothrix schenckii ATCC 58251]|uniref:Uncharacterized protein n=1 Tax=Sporothrix schenckii (strain ATCC 58251 / de Perez 2211183) TaxID=1391915 RepID=U7PYG6_SPOS1|nr:hypothetical protein HMPREF1624_04712 [Sporothrix schenckii ATCC 58251]
MARVDVVDQRSEEARVAHGEHSLVHHDLDYQLQPEARNSGDAAATAAAATASEYYTSGCAQLDSRIFGGGIDGGLTGGLVGLSAEGDVGIVISLQVAVKHLYQNTSATARLITTLPVAHVIRLLKGVLKGTLAVTSNNGTNATSHDDPGPEQRRLASASKASILGRILISRVYGREDLEAVLNELEAGMPFQRLWSTVNRQQEEGGLGQRIVADKAGQESHPIPAEQTAPPSIIIFTEMDHHFKWMRLQSNGGRLYELYGQLMRRLRALAAAQARTFSSDATNQRLIFVLNSTITWRPEEGRSKTITADDGTVGGANKRQEASQPQTLDPDATYGLALAALQQRRHIDRPDVFRLCCNELARAQCIEPRYKTLLDYYCSLHICLTRLPVDLVDLWGGRQGGSTSPADSSLWVATVESDENEISQRATGRTTVAYLSSGIVQDAALT